MKVVPNAATVLIDFSIYQVSILIAVCLLLMMYPIVVKIDFSQVIKSAKTPNLNCFYTTNYLYLFGFELSTICKKCP